METSRLCKACALVSRAMDRSPGALAGVTAGEVRRAMQRAARIDDAGDRELLEPARVEHVHASWFVEPLARLHPSARTPLLRLLPRHVARFASLALERATGETLEDAPAARGDTAARLAAALMPPLGPAAPALLGSSGARDPLSWVSRNAGALPCELVFTRWPALAGALEASLEGADVPAGALVTLAACLAARPDDARAIAARMPMCTGAALLAARSRWALALEPGEAAELYDRLATIKGDRTS